MFENDDDDDDDDDVHVVKNINPGKSSKTEAKKNFWFNLVQFPSNAKHRGPNGHDEEVQNIGVSASSKQSDYAIDLNQLHKGNYCQDRVEDGEIVVRHQHRW